MIGLLSDSKPQSEYGSHSNWEFDYPWEIIETAIWLWSMSGLQHLPTQDEVAAYDPRYIADIKWAYRLYRQQSNSSLPQQIYDRWEASQKLVQVDDISNENED